MLMSDVDILVKDILETKMRLEKEGKHPRLVIINKEKFRILESEWIESIKSLPWGDALEYELQRRASTHNIFLGDGTLCGLWVVSVDTIDNYEVR